MNSGDDVSKEVGAIFERLRSVGYQNEGNTQTVIHRTEGPSWVMGMVLGVAIATCVATWFGMIIIYDDIRDLKAWSQVHNNEISALKAHQGDK